MEDAKVVLEQTLQYFGRKSRNAISLASGDRHPILEIQKKGCTEIFMGKALQKTLSNFMSITAIHDDGRVQRDDGSLFTPMPGSIYKLYTYEASDNGVFKTHTKNTGREEFVLFLDGDSPVRSHDLNELLNPKLRELIQRPAQVAPTTPEQHTPATAQPSAVIN